MAGTKKTRSQLLELYKGIMPLLKKLQIKSILFYGTLLGFQREANFIEEDDDIDLIVSRDDFNKLLAYARANSMLRIEYSNLLQLCYNDIGPFDVYAYDMYGSSILIKHAISIILPSQLIFPLKQVLFHDIPVYVPSDVDETLVLLYGPDWRTPVSKENLDWEKIVSKIRVRRVFILPKFKLKR